MEITLTTSKHTKYSPTMIEMIFEKLLKDNEDVLRRLKEGGHEYDPELLARVFNKDFVVRNLDEVKNERLKEALKKAYDL